MPPAASTGTSGPIASTTSGHSTIDEISPVWPPASVPCATMMSTPFARCFSAWRTELASAATCMPCSCAVCDDVRGRRAERVDEQRRRGARARPRAGRVRWCRSSRAGGARLDVVGHRRDAVLGEDLLDEVTVLLRDHRLELAFEIAGLDRGTRLGRERGRHHEIDAVRLAVDVLVDPGELHLELVGGEVQGPEHAESAGVGHCRDDVAAVAEREDRELDAEGVTDWCTHDRTLARTRSTPLGCAAMSRGGGTQTRDLETAAPARADDRRRDRAGRRRGLRRRADARRRRRAPRSRSGRSTATSPRRTTCCWRRSPGRPTSSGTGSRSGLRWGRHRPIAWPTSSGGRAARWPDARS